jgi:hypothetical protein
MLGMGKMCHDLLRLLSRVYDLKKSALSICLVLSTFKGWMDGSSRGLAHKDPRTEEDGIYQGYVVAFLRNGIMDYDKRSAYI